MASEWPEVKLRELAAEVPNALVGGPFGSNLLARDRVSAGVPVIQGSNMGNGRWVGGTFVFVTEEKADRLAANTASSGDIVFTQRGTVGQVALVPDTFPRLLVSQSQMKLTPNPRVADVRYLYYWFSAPRQVEHMKGRSIQTGVPHTNLGILGDSPVTLPPLSIQRRIASVLGALDDKIELNRKMSKTLDETASTLFRSWFVDPVRDAWPSGEGQLPEGWSQTRFSSHVEAVRGLSYSSHNLVDAGQGLPLHNLNTVLEGGGFKHAGMKWFDGSYKERNVVTVGDLVVANVEQGFEFLLIGFGALVPRSAGSTSLFSADLFRLRPLAGSPLTAIYLYQLLREPRFHRIVAGYSNGTTVNHLSQDAFIMPSIVVPPADLVARYTDAAVPMLVRMELLHEEARVLAERRDALLPRLLSGELRLPVMSCDPKTPRSNG